MQQQGQLPEEEEDTAVLTYLWQVVIMADKQFLPDCDHHDSSHNNNDDHDAKTRELLCIKNTLQRAVLQSLIPKAFWNERH